ncbi:hypothetical protein [Saccharothrix sp. Mg75]|uniref:hypothetical protein n=1 Tax=Saccharothrix sp. Mg75 TaxID=3445357 RepID=UPI003EE8FA03
MKRRTRGTVVLATGFVVGLLVGLAVLWETRSAVPTPEPSTGWSPVPAQEPEIEVAVVVGGRGVDEGWVLLAPEALARSTPPDDVVDCPGLQAWALREGALPAGVAEHTITLSANYSTTVESVHVRVSPDPAPYREAGGGPPKVRLACLPRPGAQLPFPDHDSMRLSVHDERSGQRSTVLSGPHEVTPRSPAELGVAVDLTGTSGPYAYRVEVGITEGNEFREVPVNGGGPLFATEDGGGMGYWPATATWTMSPTRTHSYCGAVENPAPDEEPVCS